jgi:hypothetical protein
MNNRSGADGGGGLRQHTAGRSNLKANPSPGLTGWVYTHSKEQSAIESRTMSPTV